MSAAEKYVAAAYGVFLVFVLVWVAIIAAKLARLERETAELAGKRTDASLRELREALSA